MLNRKKYAALLLGLSVSAATLAAVQPTMTAQAAVWEKNANGSYTGADGSQISGVYARGIDVSHWKQTIDWNRVAADDIDYVMLGTRYNNEVDPYFGTNAIGAFNAGLKVGAYIYSYATTPAMAEAEADFVLNLIKDYPISYPVVIDVESSEMSALSPSELANVINAFCQKIEKSGYYPMVYSNDYWLSNKIDMTKLHYDVWAARYDVKPTYAGAAMWQATNQGEVNGISGAVDINFTLKDFSAKLPANRWRLIGDKWYYYTNYVKQTGWINDGQSWYFLNTDGTQVKGWIQQDGEYYYLLPTTGQMQTGWEKIDDAWYYLKADGRMANEWLYVDDKYYYLYNGQMVTGWLRIGEDYYYMKGDGSMVTGWRKMDGAYYYFNADGTLVRGWLNVDGDYYYLKTDGTMVTGWQTLDNKTYYFNPDGDLAMKWTKIGDDWYYFAEDGTMMTGWIQLDGRYYYLHTDGRMVTGWQSDGTNHYYMDPSSGKMAVGWKEIAKTWYYFSQSGHMIKGWLKVDGKYYYMDPSSGKMYANGSYKIENVNYTFDKDGVCQNEASAIDGGSAVSVFNSPTGGTGSSNVTNATSTPGTGNAPGTSTTTPGGSSSTGNVTVVNPGGTSSSGMTAPGNSSGSSANTSGTTGGPGNATAPGSTTSGTTGGPGGTTGNATGSVTGTTTGMGNSGNVAAGPGAYQGSVSGSVSSGSSSNTGNQNFVPGSSSGSSEDLKEFQTGGPQ